MDKDLEIIFRDMEEEGLMNWLRDKKSPKSIKLVKKMKMDVDKIAINGIQGQFIVKHEYAPKGFLSVVSSQMYRQVGINTPQVCLLGTEDKKVVNTIQEDVTGIASVETILAFYDTLYNAKIDSVGFGRFKWQIFYDRSIEEMFLKFMTPNCLEQLKDIFLADELRTDIDRHLENYFLVKRKGSEKYEGIIVVDLDQMIIYNYCGTGKDDFENFLMYPYASHTPQVVVDRACYKQRVVDLCELIQDGVLSDGNIETLKKILQTDFPKDLMQACKKQRLSRRVLNNVVNPVEYLWEYNNQTVGRELGL